MAFTLLVLAAGMGSRYGGLKQIDPIGRAGELLLDYAVFDALAAGCDRVVFVIRGEFEELFRQKVGSRFSRRVAVDYVLQTPETLPPGFAPVPGREKPWGTGHAVWCASESIRGNFAVINADDFYGSDSFARLARFFSGGSPAPGSPPRFGLVGFRLSHTLSKYGTVSRGICTASAGRLQTVVEKTEIAASGLTMVKKLSR
jgi:UTP-glucose-1-phosphate uridylyltransferase